MAGGVPDEPAGAVVAYLATIATCRKRRDADATGHFDWLGSVVIALAVGGLAFGAIRGQQRLDDPSRVSLGVGAIAAIAFPFLMLHRRTRWFRRDCSARGTSP